MIKKSLVFIVFVVFFLLFTNKALYAQGTYGCYWDSTGSVIGSPSCQVDNFSPGYGCEEGYVIDTTVCDTFDINDCDEDTVFECIPIDDSDEQQNYYSCLSGGSCAPCDPNAPGSQDCYPFESIQACNPTCASGGFKFGCTLDGCAPTASGSHSSFNLCAASCVRTRTHEALCEVDGDPGVYTALGCFQFGTPAIFTSQLSIRLMGIAGGIALILFAYAAILYMLSAGDPERLSEAKSIIIAAVTGLIVMSSAILVFRFVAQGLLGLF